jgi:hypothetical protein
MRYELTGLLGAIVLAAAMTTAGCSDSSDDGVTQAGGGGSAGTGGGGGGDSFTTLSGTATLSTLTAADATRLCDDTYAYFRTAISTENACKWRGLSFATSSSAPTQEQLRANCAEKETQCLADPATAFASSAGCSPFPSNCGATVAEYSSCVKDMVAGFNPTVTAIAGCDVLTSQDTDAVWAALGAAAPASCSFSACPGLFPPNPLY